jgi:exosortase A-associated hydrolase 2
MSVLPQAFFLPTRAGYTGQRFGLFYPAQGMPDGEKVRGVVLYIHPFAEEMNKSRRMAALQARALAQAGYAVLQLDLLGCGDSSGDFGDATWDAWVNDVLQGCQWLRSQYKPPNDAPAPPLWLWGLRAGCLLAVDATRQLDEPCNLLFWQAPAAGKTLLQQFLRLKAAGDLLGGQAKAIMQGLRDQLAAGEPVEIAGYQVAAQLASGLEQATLAPPRPAPAQSVAPRMVWLEVSTREDASFSPASSQAIAAWQQAGYALTSQIVSGPAFWQTSEIEEAPALIAATTATICA